MCNLTYITQFLKLSLLLGAVSVDARIKYVEMVYINADLRPQLFYDTSYRLSLKKNVSTTTELLNRECILTQVSDF